MSWIILRIIQAFRDAWSDLSNERDQERKLELDTELEIEKQRSTLTDARVNTILTTAKYLDTKVLFAEAKSGVSPATKLETGGSQDAQSTGKSKAKTEVSPDGQDQRGKGERKGQ